MNINADISSPVNYYNENWKIFFPKLQEMHYRDEMQRQEIVNDWLEFNWELILQSSICKPREFLLCYGEGTDSGKNSDRFIFAHIYPTHKVVCSGKEDLVMNYFLNEYINLEQVDFFKFVTGDYKEFPPFDYSLLVTDDGENLLVKNIDVNFFKIPYIE